MSNIGTSNHRFCGLFLVLGKDLTDLLGIVTHTDK